jgi:hypothetical protein
MKNFKSHLSAATGKGKVFGRTICTRSTSPSKLPFGMTAFLLVVLALSVGYGAAQAQSVNSGRPQPFPFTDPIDLSSSCALLPGTLMGDVTGNMKTLTLRGGTQIAASPNLRISITNTVTHTTVSYVITGTSKYTPLGNDLVYVTSNGKNLVFVPEANGHPPGLFLTTGTVNFVINGVTNDEVRTFTGQGTVIDVCKVLAV